MRRTRGVVSTHYSWRTVCTSGYACATNIDDNCNQINSVVFVVATIRWTSAMGFVVEFVVTTLQRRSCRYTYVVLCSFNLNDGHLTVFPKEVAYGGVSVTKFKQCSKPYILDETLDRTVNKRRVRLFNRQCLVCLKTGLKGAMSCGGGSYQIKTVFRGRWLQVSYRLVCVAIPKRFFK